MASSNNSQMASSTCLAPPCTVRGTHQFEIVGYSLMKGCAAGEYVRSGSFAVGGYRWSIRFYQSGFSAPHRAYVSAFLKLTSKNSRAWARYNLRLVDRGTGLSRSVRRAAEPVVFVYSVPPPPGKCKSKRGARAFMRRSKLEASAYLRDDRLTIECVIDVVSDEARVPEAVALCRLRLPPSDLAKHLGDLLLKQQDNADVTLDVQGDQIFRAHRVVLAARSPVFMAELYGQMKEKAMERIAIDDMQPVVFKALLHFIYTDTLLLPGDLHGDDYREMVRHLLEAADRYGTERLKLICESILCRSVDGATVETTLALADRHYCQALTDVCLQFMSLEIEE